MSALKRGDGNIPQIVSDAAFTVDVPVKVGTALFGVPIKTVAISTDVGLETRGIFALPKVGGASAYTLGDRVYWNAGTSKATKTATDDLIGICTKAATAGATEVEVYITGQIIDPADADSVAAAGAVMDSDFAGTHRGIMVRTGAGAYTAQRQNISAAVAPGVADDSAANYAVGSFWLDTTADKAYVCVDSTAGAAVWVQVLNADVLNANTILYAVTDNVPAALAVAASRIVGRAAAGDIVALTPSQTRVIAATGSAVDARELIAGAHIDYSRMVILSDQSLGDDDVALTSANMLGAIRIAASAPRTKATAIAAAIVAALPGAVVGTAFDMGIANTGASTLTLTAGAGVTTYGNLAIAATGANTGYGTWRVLCTNVTGGAEAVSMYRIG